MHRAPGQEIAEASRKQRTERRTAQIHSHEVERHREATLVGRYDVLNRRVNKCEVSIERRVTNCDGYEGPGCEARRLPDPVKHDGSAEQCNYGGHPQTGVACIARDPITEVAAQQASEDAPNEVHN